MGWQVRNTGGRKDFSRGWTQMKHGFGIAVESESESMLVQTIEMSMWPEVRGLVEKIADGHLQVWQLGIAFQCLMHSQHLGF